MFDTSVDIKNSKYFFLLYWVDLGLAFSNSDISALKAVKSPHQIQGSEVCLCYFGSNIFTIFLSQLA